MKLVILAVGLATSIVAIAYRISRRTRVAVYYSDGLLSMLPPSSPAALQLRAAAGDVIRALSAKAPAIR